MSIGGYQKRGRHSCWSKSALTARKQMALLPGGISVPSLEGRPIQRGHLIASGWQSLAAMQARDNPEGLAGLSGVMGWLQNIEASVRLTLAASLVGPMERRLIAVILLS
jgi:hypothetical protein